MDTNLNNDSNDDNNVEEYSDKKDDIENDNNQNNENKQYSDIEKQKYEESSEVTNDIDKERFNENIVVKEDYYQQKEDESQYIKEANTNERHKKSKNKFMASAFVTILMILIFSVASVGSYQPTKELLFSKKDPVKTYIGSDTFNYRLARTTRILKRTIVEGDAGYTYDRFQSIQYYISDKDKTMYKSNIKELDKGQGINEESENDIKAIIESKLEELKNNSKFYIHIRTDEKGYSTIENSIGDKFDQNSFKDRLNLRNENRIEYANLDIIYMIPNDFIIPLDSDNYQDEFIRDIQEFNMEYYMMLILGIGAVSILILSIVAFSIPYEAQRKISICRLFNKMFLELKGFIWLGFVCSFVIGANQIYYGFRLNEEFNITNMIYNANVYFYIIGIPITFILYLLIYLSIVYIKHIYHTGLKEGLIENSILGKICFYIIKKLNKIFREIVTIDVTKSIYRKLIMILGINLIALWIIALTGPFGLVLGVAYTLFLFKYLLKFILKIKSLNDATSKLAEGDFDISFDENMGIFSPICENLNNIKDGFKVAIDRAIKSQNMKTELISNVSHDLKTPLTSIITYIDLLKSEELTDETKNEYIDILDRKSKRLKVLIEDLFEASKASSGNIDLHLENVDVIALFRQTLGELEEKINQSTLQFKMDLPENKVICKLDGRRTYRVFENIMSNILKYALDNSRVYIDVSEDEKEISFTFKNISAYEMNFDAREITERFTRGDKSRNTEGSGLGLAIAKSLMELQNGKLTVTIDGDLFKVTVAFQKWE